MVLTGGKTTGDTLVRRRVASGVISSARYLKDTADCRWHCHESIHLTYVFSGSGRSEAKGAGDPKSPDEVCWYRAGEMHRWIPQTSVCRSINVEFADQFANEATTRLSDIENALSKRQDSKFLMLKIQSEMALDDAVTEASLTTLLQELAYPSIQDHSTQQPDWVAIIEQMLKDEWNAQPRLDRLAHAAGVHPVTISRSFRRHFSCTLGEYVRKQKIERSLPLLQHTNLSLSQIAQECGFADQSHFSRCFRQLTGFTPGRYRRL